MCSENMQKMYWRTLMPKYNFTLRHGCSHVNLLHIFRTPLPKNACGRLFQVISRFWVFFLYRYALTTVDSVNVCTTLHRGKSRGYMIIAGSYEFLVASRKSLYFFWLIASPGINLQISKRELFARSPQN